MDRPGYRPARCAPAPPASAETVARHRSDAIHDYLLVASRRWSLQALQENQKRQQAAQQERSRQALPANRAALLADPTDAVVGNPAGAVTVVEFLDYSCPICKRVAPDLERLVVHETDCKGRLQGLSRSLALARQIAAVAGLASMRQNDTRHSTTP